jgi:hypothetical protein
VQESCLIAVQNNESDVLIGKLFDHYYEIQAGIGVHKSPELYGAFPTDPYSHTPAGKGAQQPGMTGQVKEDILCRSGELGVFVKAGKIIFNPRLLRASEFVTAPKIFKYLAIDKEEKEIALAKGSLCFTYCQVPVIYIQSDKKEVEVIFTGQPAAVFNSLEIDVKTSQALFDRTGEVHKIIVHIKA